MFSKRKNQPSPTYVFVVLSLAAFLTLFTLWRRPVAQYVASVSVMPPASFADDELPEPDRLHALQAALLSPESVLQALQHADMMDGDGQPEMLEIAAEIASRMRVTSAPADGKLFFQLALRTEHPGVALKLLEQMLEDTSLLAAAPATATRMRGTAIPASSLVLLILCSVLVGVGGLMLSEQSKQSPVLVTEDEVMETANLPVIVDFTRDMELPARTRQIAWRRRFGSAVRAAELAIAATIVLILYNVLTQHAFSDLLVSDPLSAYSEALGRFLG